MKLPESDPLLLNKQLIAIYLKVSKKAARLVFYDTSLEHEVPTIERGHLWQLICLGLNSGRITEVYDVFGNNDYYIVGYRLHKDDLDNLDELQKMEINYPLDELISGTHTKYTHGSSIPKVELKEHYNLIDNLFDKKSQKNKPSAFEFVKNTIAFEFVKNTILPEIEISKKRAKCNLEFIYFYEIYPTLNDVRNYLDYLGYVNHLQGRTNAPDILHISWEN